METKQGRTFHIHDTPGSKGTIIAVHGLTGNYKQMVYYQKAFYGEYRFISYDLRGRGNSDPADQETSILTHADDLMDLIDTLDIEDPILMGYSMGGYICAIVASHLPNLAGLILLDGAGEVDHSQRELIIPSLNRLKKTYASPEDYVNTTKAIYENLGIDWNQTLDEIARYEIKKNESNINWIHKSDSHFIEQDFESFYSFDSENTGPSISCPTLLIIATGKMGDQPSLFNDQSYMNIKQLIPNIHSECTEANHYTLVFNQQPDIIQHIGDFLES